MLGDDVTLNTYKFFSGKVNATSLFQSYVTELTWRGMTNTTYGYNLST